MCMTVIMSSSIASASVTDHSAVIASASVTGSGEDSTPFSRHNKLLLSESTKAHPKKAVVAEAMKLLFAMKRNDIVANTPPIPDLLAKYISLSWGQR